MPRFRIAAIAAFSAVLLAGAGTARAQGAETFKATVSFPFVVGNVLMPAGTYVIVPDEMDPTVLEVRAERGGKAAFVTIMTDQRSDHRGECLFQFVNVGGRYYLSTIDDGVGDLSEITLPEPILRAVHGAARTLVVKR